MIVMRFYHGTDEMAWKKIQEEGVLWGVTSSYRYTYLTPEIGLAKSMGRGKVILEVEYDPVGVDGRGIDNYGFDPPPDQYCWQFSVFVPIPIDKVRRLSVEEIAIAEARAVTGEG
jgi:hypothetical protein